MSNLDPVAADLRHIWHPFTPMSDWLDGSPLMIERGEGNYLIDVDGNRYFDAVSSLWVNVHGHGHPQINQAIRDQHDLLAHSTLLGASAGAPPRSGGASRRPIQTTRHAFRGGRPSGGFRVSAVALATPRATRAAAHARRPGAPGRSERPGSNRTGRPPAGR